MATVNKDIFWSRLGKIFSSWQAGDASWGNCRSVVILAGSTNGPSYRKSLALESWLFGFELHNTILVLTHTNCLYVLASANTCQLLRQVGQEYSNLRVFFLQKNKQDKNAQNKASLLRVLQDCQGSVGMMLKEDLQGNLVTHFSQLVKQRFATVDVAAAFAQQFAIKDEIEQGFTRMAASFSKAILKRCLVMEMENAIDDDSKITHSQLAEKAEKMFETPSLVKSELEANQLESCYCPVIQSGGNYNLKPSAMSDDKELHTEGGGTIMISAGARYKLYCSNITRTYFIDPSKQQKQVYGILTQVFQAVLKTLRHGVALCQTWEVATAVIKKKRSDLLPHFNKNCGFGTGLEFREPTLVLNKKNKRVAQAGMVFNVCVGFSRLIDQEKLNRGHTKAANYACMIADTVIVTRDDDPEMLTHVKRSFDKVQYTLNDSDSEVDDEPLFSKKNEITQALLNEPVGIAARKKRRRVTIEAEENRRVAATAAIRRAAHQKVLHRESMSRFERRLQSGYESDDPLENYQDPQAYRNARSFPSNIVLSKIKVDTKHDAILFPIGGGLVPFHISLIKSVNIPSSAAVTYLRINFISPSTSSNSKTRKKTEKPTLVHDKQAWITELSYHSSDKESILQVQKLITTLKKQYWDREASKNAVVNTHERLILHNSQNSRSLVFRLRDLKIKPPLKGKKNNYGTLETHVNGFLFRGNSGARIEIIYNNIKHAFFQPCAGDTISVLLHFRLRAAIHVGTRSTIDVTFARDVMDSSEDINASGFHTNNERQEKKHRHRINKMFKDFTRQAERRISENKSLLRRIEFEEPFTELKFHGVPGRANVLVMPTVHCLVALHDTPPFVLSLADVEVASFERVQVAQLRSFDVTFLMRDMRTHMQIGSIPVHSLESLKKYLDDANILFYECQKNLDWATITRVIRRNPHDFQTSGWAGFFNQAEEEKMDVSDQPVFRNDNIYSDDEDRDFNAPAHSEGSEDDDDEYGSEVSENFSSSEGEDDADANSWETHEKRAREEEWGKSTPNGAGSQPQKRNRNSYV